jgi:hypothetical protein
MRVATFVLVTLWLAAPAGAAPATRDEAVREWASIVTARSVQSGWTGSVEGCRRGTESSASIGATATAVNGLRDFAGLDPVTFDPVKNDKALAAALMMEAAGRLDHAPDASFPCYTAEGREGAGSSNLFLGAARADAMVGYADDGGVDSLGHRRWLLDPAATTFGTGSTARANALWVFPDGAAPASGPPVVAWPPAGWIPWDLVPGTWSAGMNVPGVDVAAAQVSVSAGGQPRAVSNVRSLDSGFGSADPTLAWEVAPAADDQDADRELAVAIDGATLAGAPYPIRYTVQAFDASPPVIESVGYRLPTRLRPGRKVRLVTTIHHAQDVALQWLRGGRPIAGATRRTYRLRKADRGRTIRCRVTATGVGTVIRRSPKLQIPRR